MEQKEKEMCATVKELKLTVELVPTTSWYRNLRNLIPRAAWDEIRKRTYRKYNHRCGICGTRGKLNCHEIWEYDDQNQIQKLVGFIALCGLCHHVKHIGYAGILASKGKLDYQRVVRHFIKVNGCSRDTFEKHIKNAFDQWNKRSQYDWYLDLGEYKNFVKDRHLL